MTFIVIVSFLMVHSLQVKASTKVSKDKGLGHFKIRGACLISRCLSGSGASSTVNKCKIQFYRLEYLKLTRQESDCSFIGRLQQFYLSFYNPINWSKLEP